MPLNICLSSEPKGPSLSLNVRPFVVLVSTSYHFDSGPPQFCRGSSSTSWGWGREHAIAFRLCPANTTRTATLGGTFLQSRGTCLTRSEGTSTQSGVRTVLPAVENYNGGRSTLKPPTSERPLAR